VKYYILLILLLISVGCSTSGPRFLQIKSTIPPLSSTNNARVFFLRPHNMFAGMADARIAVDGKILAKCPNGAFFWEDIPSGQHIFTADHWGNWGAWNSSIEISPSQEYFILIEPRADMMSATLFLSFVGQLGEAITASTGRSGTFQLSILDKQDGLSRISDLVFQKN
jgi:hypothetical protein